MSRQPPMKLLKSINLATAVKSLKEDAAVGAVDAGSVASCAMPLFSRLVQNRKPKTKIIKWAKTKAPQGTPYEKKVSIGLKEAFVHLTEFSKQGGDSGAMSMNMDGSPASSNQPDGFDSAAVIAKLKGLEDTARADGNDQNTTSFGLEDENGGIVRVTVVSDQAEAFEKALQAYLAKQNQGEDDVPEVAEVLFKLKDRFDIIHVQWPEVQEDEEEDVSLKGDDQGQGGDDLDIDGQGGQGGDAPPADTGAADEGQVKDLLTQVIDMMKADAEARKAEAKAREAEAKTKEADQLVQQVTSKVKQEEQFLDMEKAEKAQKDEEREVKRLAKLARWKHEMGDTGDKDSSEEPSDSDLDSFVQSAKQKEPLPQAAPREEEERAQSNKKQTTIRGRVHPHDIASFILSRVK